MQPGNALEFPDVVMRVDDRFGHGPYSFLFGLDAGILDARRPFDDFASDEGVELIRRL